MGEENDFFPSSSFSSNLHAATVRVSDANVGALIPLLLLLLGGKGGEAVEVREPGANGPLGDLDLLAPAGVAKGDTGILVLGVAVPHVAAGRGELDEAHVGDELGPRHVVDAQHRDALPELRRQLVGLDHDAVVGYGRLDPSGPEAGEARRHVLEPAGGGRRGHVDDEGVAGKRHV